MSNDRILVVEDNQAIALVIRTILSTQGATVLHASTGEEALAIDTKGDLDCLIADLLLPGSLNGDELGRRLRQRFPSLPVILISGDFKEGAQRNDLLEGAHFLSKPFRRSDLLAALDSVKRHSANGSHCHR